MRRLVAGAVVAIGLVATGCRLGGDDLWFRGGFEAAAEVAQESDSLIMLEFYTDWCTWCRRLEAETFADDGVRGALRELVAMRVNAEKGGEELARRYGVDSYPTLVFVDASGSEVDRILGYLPPDTFMGHLERIRFGDTFAACLARLHDDPDDLEALQRSVDGLLDRSDPEGAIARIMAYHGVGEGHSHTTCRRLMFSARASLLGRSYDRAARLYRSGWNQPFEVPDTEGVVHLREALIGGVADLELEEQARLLRVARLADAADLLAILPPHDELDADDLLEGADFAVRSGHYEVAAELYVRWFGTDRARDDAARLSSVAWNLYLSGQSLETAVTIARQAYAKDPSPSMADTLARLLYVTGDVDEAIVLQTRAAREAEGRAAEAYLEAAKLMEAGEALEDRPGFETYPGEPDSPPAI